MTEADGGKLVDWQVIHAATGGNPALLRELIEIFLTEVPKHLSDIDEAIRQQAADDLRRHAHTIKGCLRYFGETPAGECARQLESMGKEQRFEGAADRLTELRGEVQRLVPELQNYLGTLP